MKNLARRIRVLSYLSEINRLAQELEERIIQAEDWLFLSEERSVSEVMASCLVKARECATMARQTLEVLEEQIRIGEGIASRLADATKLQSHFESKH